MAQERLQRSYKGVVLDYDCIRASGTDSRLVCLNSQQIMALLAHCVFLHWLTRWQSAGTLDMDWIDGFAASIEEELIMAMCLQFRSRPDNACIKEYSMDGGATWVTMWNDALCAANKPGLVVDATIYGDSFQTVVDDRDVYLGNITNLYANWQYGDGDDQYRDAALCFIIQTLVKTVCDLAIEAAEQTVFKSVWEVFKGVAKGIEYGYTMFVMFYEAIGDWALLPAVVVAVGRSLWGIYSVLKGVDVDAFRDLDARNDVICAILAETFQATPAFGTWSVALDGFTGSDNAEKVADVIKLVLDDEDVFMEFFARFGDAIALAKSGIDLGCPCAIEWYHTIDLTTVAELPSWIVLARGSFVQGVGVVPADYVEGSPQRWYRGAALTMTHPQVGEVRRFKVTFTRFFGRFLNSASSANYEFIQSPQVLEGDSQSNAQSGNHVWEDVEAPLNTYEQSGCKVLSSRWDSLYYGGSVVLERLEWWGSGDNPFT